ncbi:MAG TPA: geranylgeranylglycerol-phosphate geranylgeranyltransferase [bacterium]|nr:geranylgeranylglycerol-phosphate geranylgeranyltransferase [bacterium]
MIARPAQVATSIHSVLVLVRPLNCLVASASVAIGAFLASHSISARSGWAAVMTLLVSAGGYVLNDYFDIAADRLTKPRRPLAAGLVKPASAIWYAVGLWLAGAVAVWLAGVVASVFYGAWVVVLVLYSSRLKATGVWGHLAVSLVASSGFLLGAASQGRAAAGLVPAGIAVIFHLAREAAKSAADVAGDSAVGVRTLAVRMGTEVALKVTLWLIVASAIASILPVLLTIYGLPYLAVVAVAVLPLLAVSVRRITAARTAGADLADAASSVAGTLKLAMLAGLVALILAGF